MGVDRAGGYGQIAVVDHGEGIPPQLREKIFQRFWRADTSRTRDTGGSGLGLAIVAGIVQNHGGVVEVLETPGGGSTFRVSLPLYRPETPAATPPTRRSDARRPDRAGFDPRRLRPPAFASHGRTRTRRIDANVGARRAAPPQHPTAGVVPGWAHHDPATDAPSLA
ncbi:sensor histidine kinase [Pseudolysinimonas kribbensis]|uniref:sensor histidine kinase n=1 Tax=Pseudolysinimonas kribbensis TaxID=433641 RepID=UPI0032AF6C0C